MIKYQLFLLFAVNQFCFTSAACPSHWMRFANNCYLFVIRYPLDWINAMTFCKAYRAKLAEVKSASENNFLQHEARRLKGSFWLGATDVIMEGTWRWISTDTILSYSAWLPKQPDNHESKEHCLHLLNTYQSKWNDVACDKKFNFICEKSA
ncbi:galactose-specific lectin nattectin-like [Saccostrea cucullata]|uniref:galactose-specific lectin nattectin-like n=1 Tax=Saccostrea cuccullata TaxID=36930 RepID=UPI002ED613DC